MADHHKRFERAWYPRLKPVTRYLVDQVRARIVPEFEARGFAWYADYGGGDPKEVGANTIPLQRREGKEWPTVEINFAPRGLPYFHVGFAALPPTCKRLGREPVPRERAVAVYAPAYFSLCKGRYRSYDGRFGYHYFSLRPTRRLRAEVDEAISLLPVIFELFEQGIPEDWLTHEFGYVAKHVMLGGSWHIFEERLRRRAEAAATA